MRRAIPFRRGVASSLVILAAACGSDEGSTAPPPPPPPSANSIVVTSGDGQTGTVATPLAQALEVRVDDTGGQPLSGVSVTWSVITGGRGGTLSSTASSTDASGLATASFTLGTGAGTESVRASIAGSSTSVTFTFTAQAGPAAALRVASGNDQAAPAGTALPVAYRVRVDDQHGNPVQGATVDWAVVGGGGSLDATNSTSDAQGLAETTHTLGSAAGGQFVDATIQGVASSVAQFHATARSGFAVAAGGSNVPERFGSDLWVHGGYAYSGTWGNRNGTPGNTLKIWVLDGSGAPSLIDSVITSGITTVSDVEVSSDGTLLMFSTEGGANGGLFVYRLTDPRSPTFLDNTLVSTGLHTATFGYIGGRTYAFAARNPANPELHVYEIDATALNPIALVSTTPIPPAYGIHDTFVRDGIAFVLAWDTGVIVYDVGKDILGGSPSNPVE
ncbi:MAG: Ig-like domain-containing protein, partial [Planctomycetota bacterium]